MRIIGWIATVVLIAGGVACGGNDEAVELASPMKVEQSDPSGVNHAPAIQSVRLKPAEPVDGDRVHAVVSVEDPDGDPIELGFEWRISGRLVPTGEPSIDLKGVTKRDRIEVVVKASDGELQSSPAQAEARIANRRPTLLGIAVSPQPEVSRGEPLVATAQANDPDKDLIEYSYRWRVNGEPQTETGDTFQTDNLEKGDEIQAIVVASDGTADSDDLESVIVRIGNSHPEIVSAPGNNWTNDVFDYEIEASDPDSDGPLRYSLKAGPKGMRVDSILGKVSWQPTPDQTGVHSIEVAVSDAMGATAVQIFEITVKAAGDELAAPPASARR